MIVIGKSKYNRYSSEAVETIKVNLPKLNIDEIWKEYRFKIYGKKNSNKAM